MYLSWTAGVRKVIYSVQGDRGAVTVDDDNIEVAQMYPDPNGPNGVAWKTEKRTIKSDLMDASHVSWFNSLFDRFKSAIETDDFVSQEAKEAFFCVTLIERAYQSASEGCREISVPEIPTEF